MARYDYYCMPCEKQVEVSRPMSEDEPVEGYMCGDCGYRMIRQLTLPAIQFKGSGFYSTDNPKGR